MFKSMSIYVFLSTLFVGAIISNSSSNWLGALMGWEINLLPFIPLMKNKKIQYLLKLL